jgi:hypothetical protein
MRKRGFRLISFLGKCVGVAALALFDPVLSRHLVFNKSFSGLKSQKPRELQGL